MEQSAQRKAELEAVALREQVKQVEATIWEAHNEDAEGLQQAHGRRMDVLRDLERAMVSDQLSSLNALLGNSDYKARFLVEQERRKAEEEMQVSECVRARVLPARVSE